MGGRSRLVCILMAWLCSSSCISSDLIEEDWPCAVDRPCANGWVCHEGFCVTPSTLQWLLAQGDTVSGDVSVGFSGTVAETFAVPGTEPRGLAFDGVHLWVGDKFDGVAYQLDTSTGSVVATAELPTGELADMTWDSVNDRLVVLMEDETVAVTGGGATLSVFYSLPGATSIAFDGTYLVTLEGDTVKRRDPVSLQSAYSSTLNASAETCRYLAQAGPYLYRRCDRLGDAGNYGINVKVYDGEHLSQTTLLTTLTLDVDAKVFTGIEVYGASLWLIGRGYGEHANQVIRVELE